ncbi:MAG: YjbQ family protein [Salinivirgaceae bacterium]|nr:YjbQ family protein [Salinivirgaceae bacterium]MBR5168651.1 secondary thiamine-phosphate synthase enzyme YjbQ [Salinivirgaceae bacterium]
MVTQFQITLPNYQRGYHLITGTIVKNIPELPESGLLHLMIQHTSAALTINENADPSVRSDFEYVFDKLIPERDPNYTHDTEGADDMPAHIKAAIIGPSVTIPITNHKLNLGTWQGIYLCEFRNYGGRRNIVGTILS